MYVGVLYTLIYLDNYSSLRAMLYLEGYLEGMGAGQKCGTPTLYRVYGGDRKHSWDAVRASWERLAQRRQ